MVSRMKVVFATLGGDDWTGGVIYQHNLLKALRQYAPQVEVYLLARQDRESAVSDERYTVIQYPPSGYGLVARLCTEALRQLTGYDLMLHQALRTIPNGGPDVIFPGEFSSGRRTALLFWIPDFQHLRLPEMFTATELRARDTQFKQGIRRATLVVLSSQDARKDFCDFAPQYEHKSRVMHFVACPPTEVYDTDPRTMIIRYNLPERFFFLPNQFWKHKNHTLALEALKISGEEGIRPFVVCAGNPSDYRHPTYFAELMQRISLWGLRDQIAYLGLVPNDHVYLLIRQSICVLNPSLFEGWSTIVEEVKSIGKHILLSDLGVHREQDPTAATYFDPYNAVDLASKLTRMWADLPSGPDVQLEQNSRSELPTRMQDYARRFVSIAREAVEIARGQTRPPAAPDTPA